MNQVRLSGAVMTHPRRIATAERLARAAAPEPLEVVVDPVPHGPPTGLRTEIRAWESAPSWATHRLVLEDDAVLSQGFLEHAERAAASAPHAAIVFHANWSSRSGATVRLGAMAGVRWVQPAAGYTPTVALLLPSRVGMGFADFARRRFGTWPGDVLMARYLRDTGVPTYVTVPSLVDHGELPSLLANETHGLRLSACFRALPSGANWEPEALHPKVVPLFKSGMALCVFRQPDGTWRTLGVERAMGRLGISRMDIRDRLTRALAELPGTAATLRGALGDTVLLALWHTAFLTGYVGYQPETQPEPATALAAWSADPLVNYGLGTLGPGGLCMSFTEEELAQLHAPLRDLTYAAVAAGVENAARVQAHTAARCQARRTLLVVSYGGPLARILAGDLTDRGYQVRTVRPEDVLPSGGATELRADAAVVLLDAENDASDRFTALAVATGVRRVVRVVGPDARASRTRPGLRPNEWTAHKPARDVTVLRIGTPYGPGLTDRISDMVLSAILRQPIIVDTPANYPLQLIHVWDLAAAIDRVLGAAAPADYYDICDDKVVTPIEVAEAVAEAVVAVPVTVDSGQTDLQSLTQLELPLSADRIEADLDWRPTYGLADGLRTLAQWLAYDEP